MNTIAKIADYADLEIRLVRSDTNNPIIQTPQGMCVDHRWLDSGGDRGTLAPVPIESVDCAGAPRLYPCTCGLPPAAVVAACAGALIDDRLDAMQARSWWDWSNCAPEDRLDLTDWSINWSITPPPKIPYTVRIWDSVAMAYVAVWRWDPT